MSYAFDGSRLKDGKKAATENQAVLKKISRWAQ
jgi:hypothetical protein